MEALVRWFVSLERFYRVILVASALFGLAIAVTGLAIGNPLFLVIGLMWIVGGGLLVRFADAHDDG